MNKPLVEESKEPTVINIPLWKDADTFGERLNELATSDDYRTGFRNYNLNAVHAIEDFKEKKGGTVHLEAVAKVAELASSVDPTKKFILWDKEGQLQGSCNSLLLGLRKLNASENRSKTVKQILDHDSMSSYNSKDSTPTIYTTRPPMNPKAFFKEFEWDQIVDYWLSANVKRDPKLMTSFKVAIPWLPSDEPAKWMNLQPHQIWSTRSGTGKTHLATVMGLRVVMRFTSAGLFGGMNKKSGSYRLGSLNGSGTYYIDEVSALSMTSSKNDENLMSSTLSYLEQGTFSSDYATGGDCRGTKQLILATNPKQDKTPEMAFLDMMDKITGEGNDLERVGRRFGILQYGYNYDPINIDKQIPVESLNFIRSEVFYIMHNIHESLFKLEQMSMPWIMKPEENISKDLLDIADNTHGDIKKFLTGSARPVHKHKQAALNVWIVDNLDLIYKKKANVAFKIWKDEREDYLQQIHDINLHSFGELEKPLMVDNEEMDTIVAAWARDKEEGLSNTDIKNKYKLSISRQRIGQRIANYYKEHKK